ncbi:MAG TPA: MBL fold metallo-hydrolase [Novosphingobium sp.]
MRLRIHHGAAQIGGNCIELASSGKTILLDLGLPLDSAPKLPPVAGLAEDDGTLLGVVLSHPHLDHYGLLPELRADIPVWLGRGAQRLLDAAAPFAPNSALPQAITPYEDRKPFTVGPFTITPYLMDHSAYDAYALLVEADGKRLFYTGDFRGHGRKAKTFERFIANPPSDIDVMLMEGTTIGRDDPPSTEQDVEEQTVSLMCDCPSMTLACFSGQNIDRFVTFFRASVRSGRTFVIDAYMANLIVAIALDSLPDPRTSDRLRVYLPRAQRRRIITDKRFDLIDEYKAQRIYAEELQANPQRYAMMFRTSMAGDLDGMDLQSGCLIYSLWPGYLDRDRTDLREWAEQKGIDFHIVHSSGHASSADLYRMAQAVAPQRLLPIHTVYPERYDSLSANTEIVANGEWVTI